MSSLTSYKDAWATVMGQSRVHLSVNTFSKQLYYFYVVDTGLSSGNRETTQNNTVLFQEFKM